MLTWIFLKNSHWTVSHSNWLFYNNYYTWKAQKPLFILSDLYVSWTSPWMKKNLSMQLNTILVNNSSWGQMRHSLYCICTSCNSLHIWLNLKSPRKTCRTAWEQNQHYQLSPCANLATKIKPWQSPDWDFRSNCLHAHPAILYSQASSFFPFILSSLTSPWLYNNAFHLVLCAPASFTPGQLSFYFHQHRRGCLNFSLLISLGGRKQSVKALHKKKTKQKPPTMWEHKYLAFSFGHTGCNCWFLHKMAE